MIPTIKKLHKLLYVLLISLPSFSQVIPTPVYPKDYFQWPLDLKPAIAANFGELRPNHYHMGLDCKTDKKQNQPVLASADGYIAKVKIEPFGFGRCIYINHPNGFTTLYAHLNEFYPELEKYITTQQYNNKSWKLFIDIPANLFPVTKGQLIAYSGNTGGSQAPHLHFEIRNTLSDKVLNPLLFGFAITDNIAPDIIKLAVYDRNLSTYEQNAQLISLKKVNGIYITTSPVVMANTSKVSFGITSFDRYTGSTNRNGIFQALVYDNDIPIVGFQLNSISYDETRYLNAHIDFKLRSNGGPFVEHLSRLPGYTNGIYTTINGDGVISIADDSIHKIKIEVKDASGNTSLLLFSIKHNTSVAQKPVVATTWAGQQKEFYPGQVNIFENNKLSFYLPENALYDSFRFQYKETIVDGNTVYQLHNNNVPIQVPFSIKLKNSFPISLKDKIVMERFWNNKNSFVKAIPVKLISENWLVANFRELGNFMLLVDTTAPTIAPVGFKDGMNCSKQTRLAFVVNDNTEEFKNFTATLDGNWLRFSNDKGRVFVYNFDEHCQPGYHELVISVEDQVGNKTQKIYHFTR